MPDNDNKDVSVQDDSSKGDDSSKVTYAYEGTIAGEEVKLTKAQLERAIYLGAQKAIELKDGKKGDDNSSKKDEPKEPTQSADPVAKLNAQVEELRNELRASSDRADLKFIQQSIKRSDLDPELHVKIEATILNQYALARHRKEEVDIDQLVDNELNDWRTRLNKYATKTIDVQKKLKDAEKTKLGTGTTKPASQDEPKPLGRTAFRSGEIRQRITSRIQSMLGE